MKFLFLVLQFLVLQFGLIQNAYSETQFCNGNAFVPSSYVYMHCTSGYCSGDPSSEFVSTSGSCSNGTTFSANGYLSRPTIYGSCTNGHFSASMIGANVDWRGTCSDGEFAANIGYFPSETVSGSCEENGSFSLQLNARSVSLSATCTTN